MQPDKACAVVLSSTTPPRILLFRHPQAGVQLVKGSLQPGEAPSAAALRELREESGISTAVIKRDLGNWEAGYQGQVWSLQLCETDEPLPERWSHQTLDDHGHVFSFFWAFFDELPYADFHPVYQRALAHLQLILPMYGYTLLTPQRADVDALLHFLPLLYPGGVPIKTYTVEGNNTWPTYAAVVDDFYREAGKACWTQSDYRRGGTEGLLSNPSAIEQASLAEIQSMLTYCVRGERFCDGHWGAMIEQGHVLHILNRLKRLSERP